MLNLVSLSVVFFIVMLNDIMLSVVMLNVFMLSVMVLIRTSKYKEVNRTDTSPSVRIPCHCIVLFYIW